MLAVFGLRWDVTLVLLLITSRQRQNLFFVLFWLVAPPADTSSPTGVGAVGPRPADCSAAAGGAD